jgi:hypothetical protein
LEQEQKSYLGQATAIITRLPCFVETKIIKTKKKLFSQFIMACDLCSSLFKFLPREISKLLIEQKKYLTAFVYEYYEMLHPINTFS